MLPEYVSCADLSKPLSEHVLRWLQDPAVYAETVRELTQLKARVAQPGASARAARYILQALGDAKLGRMAA